MNFKTYIDRLATLHEYCFEKKKQKKLSKNDSKF